ncbi:MAG: hypothetical protein ABJA67_16340 [Chthonomonadales bacterium]
MTAIWKRTVYVTRVIFHFDDNTLIWAILLAAGMLTWSTPQSDLSAKSQTAPIAVERNARVAHATAIKTASLPWL